MTKFSNNKKFSPWSKSRMICHHACGTVSWCGFASCQITASFAAYCFCYHGRHSRHLHAAAGNLMQTFIRPVNSVFFSFLFQSLVFYNFTFTLTQFYFAHLSSAYLYFAYSFNLSNVLFTLIYTW